ncbi:hypothetical protein V5799_009164 [Amblyomma americanum]|uniref:Uncharacterized protein n=1 Tax=Amblyomma americanum TaxID=6943 RepID=A0AAQ4FCV2_AMBAM
MAARSAAVVVVSPVADELPVSPTPRRVPRPGAIAIPAAFGVMFVAAVACALVWVVLSLPPRPGRKNTTQNPFCCPEEAAQLFAVIDKEHSPCKDFFAHVCKNAIKEGVVKEDVTKDILPLCRELTAGVAPVRSASCCHDCHEPAHRTGSSGGVALPVIHQPSGSRLLDALECALKPVSQNGEEACDLHHNLVYENEA